ncbi:MAG: phage tail tape measure protein, partial [Dehalococcoidia bacterium]|nr:phage tail tape measure protein [Dehalococcoidia bacterium]
MATLASLVVKIMADTQQFVGQLDFADKQVQRFGRRMDRVGQQLQRGGTALTAGLTLPLVGLGVAAGKTAIDFESSFAGIRKTMDLTAAEFDQLAQANRDLAKEIPVSVNELNRIGELAGQLGIRGVDNVVKFEDTIAKLAVTTDLTADDAALAFAQIANVIQLPQDQIDRLGASVVGLGNNFATTESKIVEFTQRIAGAGKIAQLSAGDLTGIATAFSSLGVEAEAGGTAVQKVLLSMVEASTMGGDALTLFARTAGMSAEEFRRAFREDAGAAFVEFVEGLGEQGDQAIATLDQLGLTDQRLMRAFLAAAGAGDLLSRAVAMGNEEFAKNEALQEEAAKRFETRASQIRVRVNQIQDALIALGIALFPVIDAALAAVGPAITMFAGLVSVFEALPTPVQFAVVAFAGLLAGIGPLLIVAGSFATALSSIIAVAPVVAGGIGGITLAVKGLTLALATNPVTMVLVVGALAAGTFAFGKFKGAAQEAADELERFERISAQTKDQTQQYIFDLQRREQLIREEIAALEQDADGWVLFNGHLQSTQVVSGYLQAELKGVTKELTAQEEALARFAEQENLTAQQTAELKALMDEFGAASIDAANDLAQLTPQMVATAVAAKVMRLWMSETLPPMVGMALGFKALTEGIKQVQQAAEMQAGLNGLTSAILAAGGVTDDYTKSTSGASGATRGLTAAQKEAEKAARDAEK